MTKPLPEAVALRAKIKAEGDTWCAGALDAANALLLELDVVQKKYWRDHGGPARLAQSLERFEHLYRRCQTAAPFTGNRQPAAGSTAPLRKA